MNLEEILLGGGGVLLVAMTLIQVAPIKVNPWSAIAKAIGRAINGEVIAKVDQLERDLEAMKAAQEERDAISWPGPGSSTSGTKRSTGSATQRSISTRSCGTLPVMNDTATTTRIFENNTTVLTSQRIKDIYEDCLAKADFL